MGREQHPTIINISTHALREEGDVPQRGGHVLANISTHALREEGDAEPGTAGPANRNFYPRPPRGGRPIEADCIRPSREFLPTPSARRATQTFAGDPPALKISTHALREEGDLGRSKKCWFLPVFLPTPSARRATEAGKFTGTFGQISTHALREEGDVQAQDTTAQYRISTHALREEGDASSCRI